MKKGHSEIWSQNFFGPPKLDAKSRPMQQIVCNQTLLEMELQTPNQPMIADWMAEISLHYNTSQCIIFLFGETWSVKRIMCDQFAKCFTIRVVISNIPWVNAENDLPSQADDGLNSINTDSFFDLQHLAHHRLFSEWTMTLLGNSYCLAITAHSAAEMDLIASASAAINLTLKIEWVMGDSEK